MADHEQATRRAAIKRTFRCSSGWPDEEDSLTDPVSKAAKSDFNPGVAQETNCGMLHFDDEDASPPWRTVPCRFPEAVDEPVVAQDPVSEAVNKPIVLNKTCHCVLYLSDDDDDDDDDDLSLQANSFSKSSLGDKHKRISLVISTSRS
jgi:hypothetical protein